MTCQCKCTCQRHEQPVSTTSPLAIEMLIHFRCKGGPFIERPLPLWPRAQRSIVEQWHASGLIAGVSESTHGAYVHLSPEGRLYAERVIDAAKAVMV